MNKNIRKTFLNRRLPAVFLACASVIRASASSDIPRFPDPPFTATDIFAEVITTADFNADGIPDVGSVDGGQSKIGVSLGNGDGTFQPVQTYRIAGEPSDIKTADLNGDDIPDLVVSFQHNDEVGIFLGNGDGTFGPPALFDGPDSPNAVALADLNEDGKVDVVVSNDDGRPQGVSVLLGNGDGTLQLPITYATGNDPHSLVLSDFDGNGHLDAAVVNRGSETVSILLGNGDGTFAPAVSYPTPRTEPFQLAVADFNRDSHPDLAMTYDLQNFSVSVFLGNADGTFQPPVDTATTLSFPGNLVAGDLNGDSISDLVTVANGLIVFQGKGDGTFDAPLSYHTNLSAVTLGQFDGTGGLDAVAVEFRDAAGFTLISGNPDGTFDASRSFPSAPAISAASADLDQDGNLDLVLAGASGNGDGQVSVYLNTGGGVLEPHVDYSTGHNTMGVAIGDLNNDGVPDLAVANEGDDRVGVLLGTGGGLFQKQVAYPIGGDPWSVLIADFNNDGKGDLATINTNSFNVSILLGVGDGTFPTHTELSLGLYFPPDIAVGDLDGDGKQDLAAIGSGGSGDLSLIKVYHGNGDGTFGLPTEYEVTVFSNLQARLTLADVDGDTKLDLIAANFGIDVLFNNGDGTFRAPVTTGGFSLLLGSLQAGDIDGNGSLDLVLGTYSPPYSNGLFFGVGDGTFTASDRSFNFGVATALGDFNNDGALDVADVQSTVLIRLNSGGSNVALLSSENPSHSGEKVTFQARVTPTLASAVPSGTVEFLDGDQTLGSVVLDKGKARFSTSNLSVGRHRIQASYSGDAIFVPRKSRAKAQFVQP